MLATALELFAYEVVFRVIQGVGWLVLKAVTAGRYSFRKGDETFIGYVGVAALLLTGFIVYKFVL